MTWRERLARWIGGGAYEVPSAPLTAEAEVIAVAERQAEVDAVRDRQAAIERTLAVLEAEARVIRASQARPRGQP